METVKATVVLIEEKHFIKIEVDGDSVLIPMSEDKADDVKSAFNKLIGRAKRGDFQIGFESQGDDLFSQVATEYIKQLNREIKEVHAEMKQHGLAT